MGTCLNTRRDWDSLWNGRFPAHPGAGTEHLGQKHLWLLLFLFCHCHLYMALVTALGQLQRNSTFESHPLQATLWSDFGLNPKHNQTTKSYLVQFPLEVAYSSALPNYTLGTDVSPRSQTLLPMLYAVCWLLTPSGLFWCLEAVRDTRDNCFLKLWGLLTYWFINCTKYRTLHNKLTVTLAVHV